MIKKIIHLSDIHIRTLQYLEMYERQFDKMIEELQVLLIDSEPLWQEAEKNVFSSVWLDLNNEQVTYTTGLRVDEVAEFWFARNPWDEGIKTRNQVAIDIVEEVKKLILEKWEAKKWVWEI